MNFEIIVMETGHSVTANGWAYLELVLERQAKLDKAGATIIFSTLVNGKPAAWYAGIYVRIV